MAAPASSPPFSPKPLSVDLSQTYRHLPPIPVFKGWPEGGLIFFTPRCQTCKKQAERCTSAEGARTGPQRVMPLCGVCTSKKISRRVTQKAELWGCEEGDLVRVTPSCLRGLRTHWLALVGRSGLEPSFQHLFPFAGLSSSALLRNVPCTRSPH